MSESIRIRRLTVADLGLLGQIDRSERQHIRYSVVDGQLTSAPFDFEVPGWDTCGDGAHSVTGMIEFARPIVAGGAAFLGASVADSLAGLVVVEATFGPGIAWLALLCVDRTHRRRGVASALWDEAVDRARALGASVIYVSATPSDSAVGFYLSRGCRLAAPTEINDQLCALEPEDIHLVCDLS